MTLRTATLIAIIGIGVGLLISLGFYVYRAVDLVSDNSKYLEGHKISILVQSFLYDLSLWLPFGAILFFLFVLGSKQSK